VLTGSGSFAPGNVVTDASGRAESLWTLGSPRGDQTARVTVEGTTEPLLISAEALPRPSILTPVGGDGETADAGTEVDEAPRVRVVDDEGEPIAGLTVGFAVVEGGGTVGDSLALTNEEGVATAGSWRLGNVAGPNVVVARVD